MRRLWVQTSRKTLSLQLEDTYQQSTSGVSNRIYLFIIRDRMPSFKQASICKCIRPKTFEASYIKRGFSWFFIGKGVICKWAGSRIQRPPGDKNKKKANSVKILLTGPVKIGVMTTWSLNLNKGMHWVSQSMPPQLQLGHLADAFIQSDLHRLIHTLTHWRQSQPCKATASSSGAVMVKCLAQGHINTQLGGAGDRTSNLSVPRQLVYLQSQADLSLWSS